MTTKVVWVVVALVLASCATGAGGGTDPTDAGVDGGGSTSGDAGTGSDAGATDAGAIDAGAMEIDAGASDGGPPDSGTPDAGPMGPPVTDGLVVHFDARNVLGNGSAPSPLPATWRDLTGGNDATCTNVRWDAASLGAGRPAMRTVGNEASHCEFPIPDFTDVAIFVVLRTTDTRTGDWWWTSPTIVGSDLAGEGNDAALILSGGRAGFGYRAAGSRFDSARSIADNLSHAISFLRTASSGEVSYRVDDFAAETGTVLSGGISEPAVWRFGSHDNEADGRFAATYGEVLIYSRVLSPTERTLVHQYLAGRWGI